MSSTTNATVTQSTESSKNPTVEKLKEDKQKEQEDPQEDVTKNDKAVDVSASCAETETTAIESSSDETISNHDDNIHDDSNSSASSDSSDASEKEQQVQENSQVEDDASDEAVNELRRSIAIGTAAIPHGERMQIQEEVHGVRSIGLTKEEEHKPHLKALFLNQFKDELHMMMPSSSVVPEPISSSGSSSSSPPCVPSITTAYELCLRKNYSYATNETGELRLMCLRATLWNVRNACKRFLHHLNAMYKYYGEDGLKEPLTIDRLDYEERNRAIVCGRDNRNRRSSSIIAPSAVRSSHGPRGVYKKGNGRSKRKGSLDSLPDMLALKSGCIQVLPSRDRSGRRVVVLQPGACGATSQQTQLEAQHSKFKAMLYFFCALARDDIESQRNGVVLILNSSKTEEEHDENEYSFSLIEQYQELCQSVLVRFAVVHLAFDNNSKNSVAHKICMNVVQSYKEDSQTNVARIRLYDEDASNDSTKNNLAPFGIPTHLIPVTHTGTIKLKEHFGWVRIQEWSDKKNKLDPSFNANFTVIECPGTNDVLFSQGGKYWNGVNRFQRGNLEFMEFLESKIDIYQSTLSWKRKHSILAECVAEFAASPQRTGNAPRFLETATQIEGVSAPDGCWVELPLSSPLLMQKIRQTLLNHIRRLESSGKRKPAPTKAVRAKKTTENKDKGKEEEIQQNQKQEQENIKRLKEDEIRAANKKRKLVHDATTVMKNNKLAMATFGNTIASNANNGSNSQNEPLTHKQSICEFLANAERIAVSTTAVDIACDTNEDHLHDSIATDEKLVQAIIANDDRLNKEVGELFEMDSFLRDEDDDGERDEIADCLMGCML